MIIKLDEATTSYEKLSNKQGTRKSNISILHNAYLVDTDQFYRIDKRYKSKSDEYPSYCGTNADECILCAKCVGLRWCPQ